jgi:hypothetical protein
MPRRWNIWKRLGEPPTYWSVSLMFVGQIYNSPDSREREREREGERRREKAIGGEQI